MLFNDIFYFFVYHFWKDIWIDWLYSCWAFVGLMFGVCWAHVGSMLGRVGSSLGHVEPQVGNLANNVPLKAWKNAGFYSNKGPPSSRGIAIACGSRLRTKHVSAPSVWADLPLHCMKSDASYINIWRISYPLIPCNNQPTAFSFEPTHSRPLHLCIYKIYILYIYIYM